MTQAKPKPAEPHVHGPDCDHDHHQALQQPFRHTEPKLGRNDPCNCGSGRKYKKCCGAVRCASDKAGVE